jgi:hypothetical protein
MKRINLVVLFLFFMPFPGFTHTPTAMSFNVKSRGSRISRLSNHVGGVDGADIYDFLEVEDVWRQQSIKASAFPCETTTATTIATIIAIMVSD